MSGAAFVVIEERRCLGSDGHLNTLLVGFRAVGVRVVAVDVGSVGPPSRFAWVALDACGTTPTAGGVDPASAVDAIVAGLVRGDRVAVLLESPMAFPVPGDWQALGKAR